MIVGVLTNGTSHFGGSIGDQLGEVSWVSTGKKFLIKNWIFQEIQVSLQW